MWHRAGLAAAFGLALAACAPGSATIPDADEAGVPDSSSGRDGGGPANCPSPCAAGQICSDGACVVLPAHCPCPLESYCDLVTNSCRPGCAAHSDCPKGRFCNKTARQCEVGLPGIEVNELAAPDCHDLDQKGPAVVSTGDVSEPPTPVPLTSLPLGLYVIKGAIDYGGAAPASTVSTRTTAFFTATRQYFLSEVNDGYGQRIALAWRLESGRLKRTILCAKSGIGAEVDYRVDQAPNGFTVYVPVPSMAGRTSAIRYEKID